MDEICTLVKGCGYVLASEGFIVEFKGDDACVTFEGGGEVLPITEPTVGAEVAVVILPVVHVEDGLDVVLFKNVENRIKLFMIEGCVGDGGCIGESEAEAEGVEVPLLDCGEVFLPCV